MLLFITDQTQISYSFQWNKKYSKPFGSESHKNSWNKDIYPYEYSWIYNDDLRVDI